MEYFVHDVLLKDVQQKMLEILVEIDRVCTENGIHYVLDSGTMLGAVRHKGFIPWDDDLDIIMTRDDYIRFTEVANKSFPDTFEFQCIENTKKYPYNFGKVFNKKTVFIEGTTKDLNICHGIYIDVFPMDYVDVSNEKRLKRQINLINKLTQLRYLKLFKTDSAWYKVLLSKLVPLKWLNFACKKAMMYRYKETDKVQKLCHYGVTKLPHDVSIFTDVIKVPFEDKCFPIPRDYDTFLKGRYGDYMQLPPPEKQIPDHYIIEVKI